MLTYNANSFRKDKTLYGKSIIEILKETDSDILVFQEFSYFKLKEFKNYPFSFVGYRNGVIKSTQVILSKYPIINKGYIDFENTMNNSMYADIEIQGKIVRIYNVHLESYRATMQLNNINSIRKFIPLFDRVSQAEKIRIAQAKIVKKHIVDYNGNVIVLGDFNSTQYSSVYQILKDSRKDTFVEAGNGFGTTYELFNYPFKIDHILVDEDFEVISHENFKINLSDHEPVLAEIKL